MHDPSEAQDRQWRRSAASWTMEEVRVFKKRLSEMAEQIIRLRQGGADTSPLEFAADDMSDCIEKIEAEARKEMEG
jgi:hypothetical protein